MSGDECRDAVGWVVGYEDFGRGWVISTRRPAKFGLNSAELGPRSANFGPIPTEFGCISAKVGSMFAKFGANASQLERLRARSLSISTDFCRFRPSLGEVWARFGSTSTEFCQFRPNLARTRPNLGRMRSKSARARPQLGRIKAKCGRPTRRNQPTIAGFLATPSAHDLVNAIPRMICGESIVRGEGHRHTPTAEHGHDARPLPGAFGCTTPDGTREPDDVWHYFRRRILWKALDRLALAEVHDGTEHMCAIIRVTCGARGAPRGELAC